MEPFKTGRPGGRSNGEVLVDYFKPQPAGSVHTFDCLSKLLSWDGRKFGRDDVRKAITGSYSRILKHTQRAVRSVRNVGYELVPADQHQAIATIRKKRADVQLLRGLQTLRNVHLEEMEPNARQSHEGMLMVVGSLYQNQIAMEKRLRAVEEAIAKR